MYKDFNRKPLNRDRVARVVFPIQILLIIGSCCNSVTFEAEILQTTSQSAGTEHYEHCMIPTNYNHGQKSWGKFTFVGLFFFSIHTCPIPSLQGVLDVASISDDYFWTSSFYSLSNV